MNPSPPSNSPSHGPLLPVVALVLSAVGLCLPPLLLVSGALGLYGYFRAKRDIAWAPRKQIAQMTLAVSGAGLLIFVGLALPHFKHYQLRIKQMECRKTLEALYAGQTQLYKKEKRYTIQLRELAGPSLNSRTLVHLSGENDIDQAVPQLVRNAIGLHGACPACAITMLCVAQLDADPSVDVWTLSTTDRVGSRGEKIPGGIAWNEVDDVDN